MKVVKLFAISVILITLSACATIFDSSTDTVTFNSTPTGAQVYINGEYRGETPLVLNLRQRNYTVEVKKDGYQPMVASTSTSLNPWVLGNIITGGFPGTTTDVVSSAAFKFDQNQWIFNLQQSNDVASNLSAFEVKQ